MTADSWTGFAEFIRDRTLPYVIPSPVTGTDNANVVYSIPKKFLGKWDSHAGSLAKL